MYIESQLRGKAVPRRRQYIGSSNGNSKEKYHTQTAFLEGTMEADAERRWKKELSECLLLGATDRLPGGEKTQILQPKADDIGTR